MQSSSQIVTINKPTPSFSQARCSFCRPTSGVGSSEGEAELLYWAYAVLSCTDDARWLVLFASHPATHWDGVCLSPAVVASKRQLLRRGDASLIDLRNYLFSRQCHVLLQLQRPAEICQRSVPFIHNCIKELRILKVYFPSAIGL